MKTIVQIAIVMVCVCFFTNTTVFASDPLLPLFTPKPPVIDGVLDDPVWQEAPSVTGFKTYTPDYGIAMVEKTVVYYAYDRENLYFAFNCSDSQPDKIKSSITSRDNVRPDDWICINLDSFNDQQSLYAFYVNPMGIQGDSRYASGNEDHSVDMVWYSDGQITDSGYMVEVRIPFKSIRFSETNPVEMGVIFERRISRRSEQGTFPPLSPERGMFFLTQMQPIHFYNIKHYTLFEVLPAITYSHKRVLSRGKLVSAGSEKDLSLTSKYGITSDLILDGTYNPDFSQVEADAGQVDVNLRYDLFYPEKRPFFQEGSENFNFSGSSSLDPLQAIVHTRTIVNPRAGVKISGKIGKKNMLASIYAADELPDSSDTAANKYAHFAILRYKRALNNDSFMGGFVTTRELENAYNRLTGVDAEIRINQSSVLGLNTFYSQSQHAVSIENLGLGYHKSDGYAAGLDYVYNTRNLDIDAGIQSISEDFETQIGYLTRTGISLVRASVEPKFYPRNSFIRRIDPDIALTVAKDSFSQLSEIDNYYSLRFILWKNSRISLSYTYSTEIYLSERFKTGGISISGSSQFTKQFYFSVSFDNKKMIRYSLDPYQGKGNNATASVIYQPSDKLLADVSFTYSDFYRDANSEKIYDYTIVRGKETYQLNKYLFFRSIIEYNSFKKTLLTDFLASFTYIPGTVLHFGYGSLYEKIRYENSRYVESNRFLESNRGFFFKTSYLWRM